MDKYNDYDKFNITRKKDNDKLILNVLKLQTKL